MNRRRGSGATLQWTFNFRDSVTTNVLPRSDIVLALRRQPVLVILLGSGHR